MGCPILVFKTSALDHSAISPKSFQAEKSGFEPEQDFLSPSLAFQASAFFRSAISPCACSGGSGDRTHDTWLMSPLLCRLSYPAIAEGRGLEPLRRPFRGDGWFSKPLRCQLRQPSIAGSAGFEPASEGIPPLLAFQASLINHSSTTQCFRTRRGEWDSNPRWSYPHTHLAGESNKPSLASPQNYAIFTW